MVQINAGKPSVTSLKSTPNKAPIIEKPTDIRTGAVANIGMAKKKGDKNRDTKNIPATTSEWRAVRPPAVIPAAHSTETYVGEIPNAAPIIVVTDSATKVPLVCLRSPLGLRR